MLASAQMSRENKASVPAFPRGWIDSQFNVNTGFLMLRKILLAIGSVTVILVVAVATFVYEPAPPKRAFVNGQVLTMDADNRVVQAVLVDEGKIVAVGSNDEIKALVDGATRVTDLQGKTLMPGIVDAHGHFPGTGLGALAVDLNSPPIGDVTNIPQLLELLKAKVDATPKGEFVMGFGYDDTLLSEHRHPTRDELDSVSPDHPLYIWHISGHMGVGNSLALEAVGYDESTPDPDGGVIARDADGRLNGLVQENAMFPLQMLAMDFSALDFMAMVDHAAGQYASVGVTTAQSGGSDGTMAQGLGLAQMLKKVPFRLVIFPFFDSLGQEILSGDFDPKAKSNDMLEIGAIKIISDGSIQGYTGYLTLPYHVPYHGDEEYRGYPTYNREELTKWVKTYHNAGHQLAVHANGDAAIDNLIHAVREAQAENPRADARTIVIHSQMARDDQLDAMKELGMTPSFFSAHTYYWGDRHRDIFMGPERAARMSPSKSALDRDLRFSVHLDPPVVPMDPMLMVWATVNRYTSSGKAIGPEQRIEPMDALRAVTIDAAWQVFQEDNRGSLEPGKWADMIILSADPLTNPAAIRDINVLETIVGGRSIYQAN